MIFKPVLIRAIQAGNKTQTRRPIKRGELGCRYKLGKDYAIQPGRGKPSNGNRIIILDVDQNYLGAITYDDARAEGFRTRTEFADYWMRLHDRPWSQQWSDETASETEILDRFEQRHAHTPVWIITFKYDQDEPSRWLAARSEYGYTTNHNQAVQDELPSVDDLTLRRFAKEAQDKPRIAQVEIWNDARAALEEQITRLEQSDLGRNVASDLRVLRRRLDALDRKINRAA